MKIVIAPDSFKGSLSAVEAAEAIRDGLAEVWPNAEYVLFPIADGGEGTVDTLMALNGGALIAEEVQDALGRPIRAEWGFSADGRTAVVETASAAGLTRLRPEERDPAKTGTYGLGLLINKAIQRPEVKRLLVGLGGSATNDGGVGLLAALGARFLDRQGCPVAPGGLSLQQVETIETDALNPRLKEIEIIVASDVQNPLTGPDGASAVFGPQKGADAEMVKALDAALAHYAVKARAATGRDMADHPGAGAAGGLGAAFMFFTEARFQPGVQLILTEGRFLDLAAGADLVVTGEGQSDWQTAWGKAPVGVAAMARQLGAPAVLLSGSLGRGWGQLYDHGISGMMSLAPGPLSLEKAMAEAPRLLREAAERMGRLIDLTIDKLR